LEIEALNLQSPIATLLSNRMKQSRYLLKKIGWALLTVLIVILLNFFSLPHFAG
jgi:hypothetical protein